MGTHMVDIRKTAIYGLLRDVLHYAPARHLGCAACVLHRLEGPEGSPIGSPDGPSEGSPYDQSEGLQIRRIGVPDGLGGTEVHGTTMDTPSHCIS